jgi:hypothetical protein
MHSWSNRGLWKVIWYNTSAKGHQMMWCKPSELTAWKASPSHNSVIINVEMWKNSDWKAVGLATEGNYAEVWFGVDEDFAGELKETE